MTPRIKTVETIKLKIRVLQRHIDDGKCGMIYRCMEKVAIEEKLRAIDPSGGDHHTRVDAGVVRFNYKGYRYEAILPRVAKKALIMFDSEKKARARASRKGEKFVSKVQPHGYVIEATKYRKVVEITRERQEQVNAARRKRKAEGRPDRTYDLRGRIQGMSLM